MNIKYGDNIRLTLQITDTGDPARSPLAHVYAVGAYVFRPVVSGNMPIYWMGACATPHITLNPNETKTVTVELQAYLGSVVGETYPLRIFIFEVTDEDDFLATGRPQPCTDTSQCKGSEECYGPVGSMICYPYEIRESDDGGTPTVDSITVV